MKSVFKLTLALMVPGLLSGFTASAQELGPNIKKISEDVYAYVGTDRQDTGPMSNAGIVLTEDGAVVIDTGHFPVDSRAIEAAVKKLTPKPVRYVILTETHGDHTGGLYVFSPPAIVIAHQGTSEALKARLPADPARVQRLSGMSPAMRDALNGYQFRLPDIEYQDKMTLQGGDTPIELINLKNAHSEADTAVWLPKQRVLFSASVAVSNQLNRLRPQITVRDLQDNIEMLKALKPEHVIAGHGAPGTVQILEDQQRFYTLLGDRVRQMVKTGKSLDQMKKELKMPEFAQWASQDRLAENIEAAYYDIMLNFK